MSDLTKIIYMKNLSYHFLVKGGGAKTYLEKRENIFIKGEKTQREQYIQIFFQLQYLFVLFSLF